MRTLTILPIAILIILTGSKSWISYYVRIYVTNPEKEAMPISQMDLAFKAHERGRRVSLYFFEGNRQNSGGIWWFILEEKFRVLTYSGKIRNYLEVEQRQRFANY